MLPRSRTSRRPALSAFGRGGAVLALLGASLAVGITAPAQAAPPAACVGSLYATDTGTGDVYPVSLTGVVGAKAYETTAPTVAGQPAPPDATTPNQLGIGKGGTYAVNTSTINGTSTIVNHDFASGTNRYLTKQLGTNVNGIAGAVNPQNGLYYYGGTTNSASPYVLWAYNPVTNTSTGPVASIEVPGAPGGNGDIAFGSDGTLYLVAASNDTTNLYRLDDPLPTSGPQQSFEADLLTSTTQLSAPSNGIAFASDGYLYLGTAATIQKVNPITGDRVGAAIGFTGTSISSLDLGTCAGPNTIEAGVTLPDNRLTPGDQFTTTVTGGTYTGPTVFPSGTTEGTDSGPQTLPDEVAGPGIVLPAETYTVSVTGAPGTNIDDYATSYRCTDASGTQTRVGQGNSFQITPTEGVGVAEDCSFTVQNPIDLTKSVSPTSFDAIGDVLTYRFLVSNVDSEAASNFRVSDPMPGLGEITCTPYVQGGSIPAGESTTCTATYTVTGDDVRSRSAKTNTATVTTDPPSGSTRTSSATSSVTAANAAVPVDANDDAASTQFRTAVTLDGSRDDTKGTSEIDHANTVFTSPSADPGGRRLATADGVWELRLDGSVLFTPDADFLQGTTSVQYRAIDTNGFTDTATLSVTVRPGPEADDDEASTPQNVTVSIPVLGNDTPGQRADGSAGQFDPERLTFPSEGQPAGENTSRRLTVVGEGVWQIDAQTGRVSFDPDPGFRSTTQPVTYRVYDQAGNIVTATITVVVRPITPEATNDSVGGRFNSPVALPGRTNDVAGTDDNGTPNDTSDDTTAEIVTAATVFPTTGQPEDSVVRPDGRQLDNAQGTWSIQPDGSVIFTPVAGFVGPTDPVTYQIQDTNGTTDTATLTVTVRRGPSATDDEASTPQGRPVSVNTLDNDEPGPNPDGSDGAFLGFTFEFAADDQPGTVSDDRRTITVPGQGTWSAFPSGEVRFEPLLTFDGVADPVRYRVADPSGTYVSALVTVTVRAIDPAATNDTASTAHATAVTLPGARNDAPGTDDNGTPDDATDDTTPPLVPGATVFPTAGQPTGSTVSNEGKRLENADGTWVVQGDGSVIFTPAAGFDGDTDPVTYRIEDRNGTTDTATLTVTVRPGPTADDETPSTPQNVTVSMPVLEGDTPGPRADGTAGTFDRSTLVFPDVPLQPGTISGEGRVLTVTGEGVYTVDPGTGVVSFDPDPDFDGAAIPVTYRVTDQAGNTVSATITVTVRAINPDATNDTASTPYATPVLLPGVGNDNPGTDDNGTPLDTGDDTTPQLVIGATVFPAAGQPTGSTVSDEGKRLENADGTWVIREDGSVLFTPATGFDGDTDAVTYRIEDTNGTTDTATLTVTVRPGPVATDDEDTTAQNVDVTVVVLGNDVPGDRADGTDGSWIASSVRLVLTDNLPVGSEVSTDGKTLTVPGEGSWTVDEDGRVTFDPLPAFAGTASLVTYEVTDSFDNADTATISVVVTSIDPVANDDSAVTRFGDAVVLAGATDDSAGADSAPIVGAMTVFPDAGQPANAVVSDAGKTLTVPGEGTWTVLADGSIRFTPADGFSGVASPVTYRIEDANGTTDTATLSVTVRPGPVPAADSATTAQNVTVTIDVIANDTPAFDVDGTTRATFDRSTLVLVATPDLPAGSTVSDDGKTLTVPGQGTWTVTPAGTVSLDPLPGFTGLTTPVTYEVTDSFGNVSGSTITVAVDARNPQAVDDSASTSFGTPVLVDVLGNDLAATGAPLDRSSLRLVDPATGAGVTELVVAGEGTWTVVDGAVRFTPADGFTGSATPVAYVVADTNGTTTRASITVVVGAPGSATPVTATTTQGEPVEIAVLDGVTPAVGEELLPQTLCLLAGTVTVGGDPVRGAGTGCLQEVEVDGVGTFEVNPDGTVTFTPADGFTGKVGIDFQVEDSGGNVYEETITVRVDGEAVTSDAPTVREKDDVLPDTGGVPFVLLLASGLSLLLGSAMMWRGRRRA